MWKIQAKEKESQIQCDASNSHYEMQDLKEKWKK